MFREAYEYFKRQVLRQEVEGRFKRQNSPWSCLFLRTVGILNLILGALSLSIFATIHSFNVDYDSEYSGPIFLKKGTYNMYVETEGFHQNHLQYTKSISYNQLAGETENLYLEDTAPYDYKGSKPYYPAGLMAQSFFQDIISIEGLEVETENISWVESRHLIGKTSYRADEIAFPENWVPEASRGTTALNFDGDEGLPVLNERFANWITISAYGRLRKLWGRLHVPEDGNYMLEIESNFDYAKKRLFFSRSSWLGNKNYYLSGILLVSGFLSLLAPKAISSIQGRFPVPLHHGSNFSV